MKKIAKNKVLVLSKETVQQLGLVQGGTPYTDTCYLSAANCPIF
jgi:hypothetical protein